MYAGIFTRSRLLLDANNEFPKTRKQTLYTLSKEIRKLNKRQGAINVPCPKNLIAIRCGVLATSQKMFKTLRANNFII